MFRKVFLLSLTIFFQLILSNISFSKVNIITTVNNEIITSYDLKKESNYLKILNPKLEKLEKNKITMIAKESLIKEIIKKNELLKFIDLEEKNDFADQYFKDILLRLGYKTEIEFNNNLIKHDSYTLEEVKFKSKIEIYWNDLIFNKYNNELNIDTEKLKKKIERMDISNEKEIFLSEIVLKKKNNNTDTRSLIKEIKASINEIGFDNTATMYSITDSSKFGGKIGWIKKKSLCIALCSKGYPDKFENNIKIDNLKNLNLNSNDYIFHAGTKIKNDEVFSNGGRVLNFVSVSSSYKVSRERVLKNINNLKWKNGFFRKDIGFKIIDK